MEEIYSWARNIVIYMILNTIIMNFLGNSRHRKYVSIVSGMILVMIVISPLMSLFGLEDDLEYYIGSNEHTVEASDFKNRLQLMEEEQQKAIFAEYRERIRKQTEGMLNEAGLTLTGFDVSFDMDSGSMAFGSIMNMRIEARETGGKKKENGHIDIGRIEINPTDSFGRQEGESRVNPPSPAEINIKIKLSDFYNIKPDNINISIQGG